jgi:hypothetical protein
LIKKEHVLKGSFALSAGQMQTLMINLPFILGDLFRDFDKNWQNFINLHQILNLCFGFLYNNQTIKQLDKKIVEYLQNFKNLYTNVKFTPKMHYLSHFPDQLENFGLLRNHSCFRFEAKNGLLSDLNFKNFINIAYSCANKHQFWMASKESELKEKNSLTYTDDLCEMTRNTVIESTHYSTLKPKKYIGDIKYAKINGFEFFIHSYIIIKISLEKDSPSVGLIERIFNVDDASCCLTATSMLLIDNWRIMAEWALDLRFDLVRSGPVP